jgi:predicted XRE-type DNA-binding protein
VRAPTRTLDELKERLAEELLALLDGWDQTDAAAQVGLRQPDISLLRSGRLERFSVGRLLRLIAARGYHIEIALRPVGRPTVKRVTPSGSVQRYDELGNVV